MKNFETTLPVIEGEYDSKTTYMSWDEDEKGNTVEGWVQGELEIVEYQGVRSVIHGLYNDDDEIVAYVIG
jgi:hypothetical protein